MFRTHKEAGILVALVVLCVVIGVANPRFVSEENLSILVRQWALLAVIAVGEAFVILTGGVDLSLGSLLALGSMLAAVLMRVGADSGNTIPTWVCAVIVLLASIGVGVFHGFLVTIVRVPSFVVTLGTLCMARGVAQGINGGAPVTISGHDTFFLIHDGKFLGLHGPFWFLLVIAAAAIVVTTRTTYGTRLYAVGGNATAARLSGVPVARVVTLAYVASAGLAGIAALLYTARQRQGDPKLGASYELFAVAAAVIGGCSLAGGEGSILGVLLGAGVIAVLNNGLILLNVESLWHIFVIGAVLVLAVALDAVRRRRRVA
ncbi:MAG: ABC transporter permease [Planctomycetes bacterium]|nr:ABC transporter permease [Planctomycetota bacterium]MBI3847053.1 ABC transporter permease [Planctomycetota bacterium]